MFEAVGGFILFGSLLAAGGMAVAVVRALVGRSWMDTAWEVQVLGTAFICGCSLFVVVEAASLAGMVSRNGLTAGWLLAATILYVLSTRLHRKETVPPGGLVPDPSFRAGLRWDSWSTEERFLLLGTGLAVLVLFLLSVFTPPTSWDSMTYHLPRVLNWIQNESVAPYATSDTRQVESGPFAAYAVMQLYLMTDSDRLVNLVQWGAMVLSLVGVSWLTGEAVRFIGGRTDRFAMVPARKAKVWSAFFVVSMPIGIVQSITTQTDYVVAFWFISTIVFGWLLVRSGNLLYAVAFGGSIALGVLTKATMVLVAGVGASVLFFWALKRALPAQRIKIAAIIAVVMAAVLAPHLSRNFKLFGNPLGSRYIHALMRNGAQSPGAWWSNVIRNLSLHAASGISPVTAAVNGLLDQAHRLSGFDKDARDTTFFTSAFRYQEGFPVSDNSAGNFWHALLIVAAAIMLLRIPSARKPTAMLLLVVAVSFVIQSGYLRWTEWNARFHLPLFLLLAPLPAIAFVFFLPGIVRGALAGGLAFLTFYCAFYNQSRPVLGGSDFIFRDRELQYFREVPYLYEPAILMANDIMASGCTNVGLRVYRNFFKFQDEMEYPFWVMLKNRGFEGKIYNVSVTNETARLASHVPIQVLISSLSGPDDEVSARLPYKSVYPPLKIYWSEPASRWVQLSQVNADASQRLLSEGNDQIEFGNSMAVLSCRAPRQGILRFEGSFAAGEALLSGAAALEIESYAGFVMTASGSNNFYRAEIPLPAGQTAIYLRYLSPGQSNLSFAIANWKWFPTDEPLSYIYVSKFYASDGEQEETANSLALKPGETRFLELNSGSDGAVDVILQAKNDKPYLLELSGPNHQTNITFSAGSAVVRLPVLRGTNRFQVVYPPQTQESVLEINRISARFRLIKELGNQ